MEASDFIEKLLVREGDRRKKIKLDLIQKNSIKKLNKCCKNSKTPDENLGFCYMSYYVSEYLIDTLEDDTTEVMLILFAVADSLEQA